MAALKANDIFIKTYNMIGIPGETVESAMETLRLNVELQPTWARCSIISPYPNTRLWDVGVEEGVLDPIEVEDFSDNYIDETMFKLPQKRELVNLQRWFQVVVRVPALLPFVEYMIKLPRNKLVDTFGRVVFGYYGSKYFGYSLSTRVSYALTFLKTGQPI